MPGVNSWLPHRSLNICQSYNYLQGREILFPPKHRVSVSKVYLIGLWPVLYLLINKPSKVSKMVIIHTRASIIRSRRGEHFKVIPRPFETFILAKIFCETRRKPHPVKLSTGRQWQLQVGKMIDKLTPLPTINVYIFGKKTKIIPSSIFTENVNLNGPLFRSQWLKDDLLWNRKKNIKKIIFGYVPTSNS